MTVTKEGIECTLKLLLDIDCEPQIYEIIKECVDDFKELSEEHFELLQKMKQLEEENFIYKESSENMLKLNKLLIEKLNKIKSNPPLKFEELKENMWVWDDFKKIYIYITDFEKENRRFIFYPSYAHLEFEENRYFEREVKENGI